VIDLHLAQKLIDRVWNYASDIVDGKIPASKKHIWACQRFFDDMEKTEQDDYKYYFDHEELYYFYEWSRMFKHLEGVLAGQPIELNDWQLFIAANLFCWKFKENGNRRFKRAFIQVARKNAKSFLQSFIASIDLES
jgi:phage terminase large subunit-like protein